MPTRECEEGGGTGWGGGGLSAARAVAADGLAGPVAWDGERLRTSHGYYLAVLEAEGCRYGLVVDDLLAPEEIVVKPLSAVLREIGLFSGATVLGNGTLALILDIGATAARAGVKPTEEDSVEMGRRRCEQEEERFVPGV